jgi:hypothetical protein
MSEEPVKTPDGRYIVVDSKAGPRLWRASNPNLSAEERARLTSALMKARRDIRAAEGDAEAVAAARTQVDAAKRGLGERGAVWWDNGSPDLNRRLVKNSPYQTWWAEFEQNAQIS